MKQIFSKEKYEAWYREEYKGGTIPKNHWSEFCYGLTVEEVRKKGFACSDESAETWCETIYEAGDHVKLKNKRGDCWNDEGFMDKYKGAVVKIKCEFTSIHSFFMENAVNPWNGDYWAFSDADIERPATAEEIAEYEKQQHKTNNADKKISVVITFDGLVTRADIVNNDTCRTVKTAEARCNPSDVYSRSEGARIAVERLFEKKQK